MNNINLNNIINKRQPTAMSKKLLDIQKRIEFVHYKSYIWNFWFQCYAILEFVKLKLNIVYNKIANGVGM